MARKLPERYFGDNLKIYTKATHVVHHQNKDVVDWRCKWCEDATKPESQAETA